MEGELLVESCGARLFGRGSSLPDPKQSWSLPRAEVVLGLCSFPQEKGWQETVILDLPRSIVCIGTK